ncbi:hypothetical protein PWY87_19620 [Kribbella solani]|uniref:hypothetical protein n=1 Tax=Kribbella solani TaxID=236067 RepID=UPI0029A23C83|nr:hypothetical protein [Kribbella solani]MDX2968177.1 hypothetical protein [Kribbella solani]MDX3003908.1 hypothetical protein [Kribbella solani]
MTVAESVDPGQYLAYQNGRAAFLLSELLTGEPSKFVRFEARTWLNQHQAWLSDSDEERDTWEDGYEDEEVPADGEVNRVLYSEGWL